MERSSNGYSRLRRPHEGVRNRVIASPHPSTRKTQKPHVSGIR